MQQSSPRHFERLMKLDELIRSPQPTFAKGLAEALEVSPRTISDDIAFLRDRFNAPITTSIQQADFNRQEYLDKIFQIEAGGEPQPIQIRFSKKVAPFIRERRWHPTQTIEEHPDGALTLHMCVPGLTEVMRWVMGYSGDAIVEGCPELVEMIRLESAKMAAHYQL